MVNILNYQVQDGTNVLYPVTDVSATAGNHDKKVFCNVFVFFKKRIFFIHNSTFSVYVGRTAPTRAVVYVIA